VADIDQMAAAAALLHCRRLRLRNGCEWLLPKFERLLLSMLLAERLRVNEMEWVLLHCSREVNVAAMLLLRRRKRN
jgi:hypothetical protein